jgi:hypothetical protein
MLMGVGAGIGFANLAGQVVNAVDSEGRVIRWLDDGITANRHATEEYQKDLENAIQNKKHLNAFVKRFHVGVHKTASHTFQTLKNRIR